MIVIYIYIYCVEKYEPIVNNDLILKKLIISLIIVVNYPTSTPSHYI